MTNIDANKFKSNINRLTEFRIRLVVKYVIYCYLQLLNDGKKYNFSERGKIPQEEFLRNGLVNDYLKKSHNKKYFQENISDTPSVEITFHPEETTTFFDAEANQQRTDKIDISIWESDLQKLWTSQTDDEIKFAIECKRIEALSDTNDYLGDIEKFCDRGNYVYTRLPFEGQLAFIENKNITHIALRDKINEKLKDKKSIITDAFLSQITVNEKYDGIYLSKHQRSSQASFFIYHLLLDYSNIVVD